MKVTEQELREMVREALKAKLAEGKLYEGSNYTAGRQVILSAQQAAFDFEKEIIKTLGLVAPDDLPDQVLLRYNEIVEEMKDDVVGAVKKAVDSLAPFPKADQVMANSQGKGPTR